MKKKNTRYYKVFLLTFFAKRVSGITVVPLIIALVLMISLSAFLLSLMFGKHMGAPLLAKSTKALYIAEAGIEYTFEYLRSNGGNWTTVPDISPVSFGGGTFALTFTRKAQNAVTAISTGTNGNAKRVISTNFTRQSVLALNPVTWLDKVKIRNRATILCEGGTPCDPHEPLNTPFTCLCIYQATREQAPAPSMNHITSRKRKRGRHRWRSSTHIISPGAPSLPWPDLTISGDYTFNPGTYYFDELKLKRRHGKDAHVTVLGPVTIWIHKKFEMNNHTAFNWDNTAANVLLIAASNRAEFKLKNKAMFSGAIYAPNGKKVELKNRVQFIGAITGNRVELGQKVTVTHDSAAGARAAGYPETFGIKASGWGEV